MKNEWMICVNGGSMWSGMDWQQTRSVLRLWKNVTDYVVVIHRDLGKHRIGAFNRDRIVWLDNMTHKVVD